MSDFKRYIVPNGGGVADHPSGRLYLRQDVDPVVDALRARIRELEAERGRLREALEKLASTATPIFTDEAGLVHFDIHPGSVALWDATADARAALAETDALQVAYLRGYKDGCRDPRVEEIIYDICNIDADVDEWLDQNVPAAKKE